jgi:hypothetical protein
MQMAIIQLILNFSLLICLLFAPGILLLAYWYRRQLDDTLMVWKKPELVIFTIIYSVLSLILFIVGVSCFFSYLGYLETVPVTGTLHGHVMELGLVCLLGILSLSMLYMATRMMLVQVITRKGVVPANRLLRFPSFSRLIPWNRINDYYFLSDYPNMDYTLIYKRDDMEFRKFSLKVPVYLRDEFEELLEEQLSAHSIEDPYWEPGRRKFSGN